MADLMRRLIIRRGTIMYPRKKGARTKVCLRDHRVLGLPTRCEDGSPGWSFVRGDSDKKEYWYIRSEDVQPCDLLEKD